MIARATWNGEIIAEAEDWEEVENNVYFPHESLKQEFFTGTKHTTTCPWKGKASYYDITVNGETNKDAAWTYKEPKEKAQHIKNHVAFWKGVNVNIQQEQKTKPSTITPTELNKKMQEREDIVIIDVLPQKYFQKQHIPTALNIPEQNATQTITDLFNKKRELILYCYDKDCLKSEHVAQTLKQKGYNVKDLEQGIEGWKKENLPTHSTY